MINTNTYLFVIKTKSLQHCAQASGSLSESLILHACRDCKIEELSKIVDAIFALQEVEVFGKEQYELTERRHEINLGVVNNILYKCFDDDILRAALPTLVEIAKINKHFAEAIDEMCEWSKTKDFMFAVLGDKIEFKFLDELYELKNGSAGAKSYIKEIVTRYVSLCRSILRDYACIKAMKVQEKNLEKQKSFNRESKI